VRVEALRDELADGALRSGVARRYGRTRGRAAIAVGGRDHDDEPDDCTCDRRKDDDGPRAHAGLVGVVIFEMSTVIGCVKIGAGAVVASGMLSCAAGVGVFRYAFFGGAEGVSEINLTRSNVFFVQSVAVALPAHGASASRFDGDDVFGVFPEKQLPGTQKL